jgi:hypothetical protein
MKLFAKWVWIIVTNYTSLKIKKEITSWHSLESYWDHDAESQAYLCVLKSWHILLFVACFQQNGAKMCLLAVLCESVCM